MATRLIPGQRTWGMTRDGEGHREYKVVFLVESSRLDGPANVLQTPGLPLPGSPWVIDDDADIWAYCKQDAAVAIHEEREGDPATLWRVEFTFSTKGDEKRCRDTQIEDPLLEPMKVSGTFQRYTEEATHDRFGRPILNSAHEQVRGPQVEFDASRPTVRVEQNVPLLQLDLLAELRDTVNDAPLWGLPARCVKLSGISWEKKFQGQCQAYYTRVFDFEVREETFDRDLLDEGTKVLHGHWDAESGNWVLDDIAGAPPDPKNPTHFDRFKDRQGENCRVILDGSGRPAEVTVGESGRFISLVDGNLNQALHLSSKWVPLAGDPTTSAWDASEFYVRGELVTYEGLIWVCIAEWTYIEPTGDPDDPNWKVLGNLIEDKGPWDPAVTYSAGQYVTNEETGQGEVHVEKYAEGNFLLLGIPLVL